LLKTAPAEIHTPVRGYSREKTVVADIEALSVLDASSFWKRAGEMDYQKPECPRLEALVYFVRLKCREGRREEAWRIVGLIRDRITPAILKKLARVYGLTRDDVDDLYQDVVATLYTDLLSPEPEHEFWEVRFMVCLERKVIDTVKRNRRIDDNEVAMSSTSGESEAFDLLDHVPDQSALDPETMAIARAALDSIPEPARTAFFLVEHSKWTEDEAGAHFGVSARTVRNYLARARAHLERWLEHG
jgi:RNA polymerase sigma factor (sigma-70 family)